VYAYILDVMKLMLVATELCIFMTEISCNTLKPFCFQGSRFPQSSFPVHDNASVSFGFGTDLKFSGCLCVSDYVSVKVMLKCFSGNRPISAVSGRSQTCCIN